MNRKQITSTYTIISVLLALVLLVVIYKEYGLLQAYYGSLSITLFILYVFDKMAAMVGATRIPEIVLHIYAVLGGFVGGFVGMIVARHKKNTTSIVLILLASALAHWGGYLYFIDSIK